MRDAYIVYAKFMVVLALALALVLPFSSLFAGEQIEDSLSAYYHSETSWHRDFFVGVLSVIAFFLILYRGLEKKAEDTFFWNETTVLNFAGIAALGVAFCPVPPAGAELRSAHNFFAFGLFLCLTIVGVVLPPRNHDGTSTKKSRGPYGLWAGGMVLGAVAAFWSVLLAEILLVASFAVFWSFRTRELRGKPAIPFSKAPG